MTNLVDSIRRYDNFSNLIVTKLSPKKVADRKSSLLDLNSNTVLLDVHDLN